MKTFLHISLFIFLGISFSKAQNIETISVKGAEAAAFLAKEHYKFPVFTRAKVYLKNGEIASVKLNYDYFKDAVKYIDEKGDTLIIANEKDINYLCTAIDSFFYDDKYYEWVASSATARLAVRRSIKLAQREKTGAYGTSSPAVDVESHGEILEATNYKLDINEVLVFKKTSTYYMSTINGHFVQANKKNIAKIFPGKKMDEFIKENHINLNKEKDLIDLFVFANSAN